MKYTTNILICLIFILIGLLTGLYIHSSIFQEYNTITYEEFLKYLDEDRINSVEIDKTRIIAVTKVTPEKSGGFLRSSKEELQYNLLPLSQEERVREALKDSPHIPVYKTDYSSIGNYLIIIPLMLLFGVLGAIIIGSRRGNIKETLFKEKKFTLESPLQKERLNSLTWQNLISGEPLKIIAAYGDLSSSEQDNYLLLLLKAIQSDDLEIRRNASFALRETGDARTVLTLCKMLQEDEDAHVRMNVAMTLGIIKDEVAIESLKNSVKDPNPLVRCAIATALGAIADEECLELLSNILDEDDNWRARRSAIMGLMKIRNDRSLDRLREALKDGEPVVRSSAAIALGDLGVIEAITDLVELLKTDPESSVRKEVIEALHSIGGEEIITPLCNTMLEDRDPSVRIAAIAALELIDEKRVTESLCTVLKNDKDADVRLFSAEVLSARKDEAVKTALRGALTDSDEDVREFVKEELNHL